MTNDELMLKYIHEKPIRDGFIAERTYPAGTVVKMLDELRQALQQAPCKTLLPPDFLNDEQIEKLWPSKTAAGNMLEYNVCRQEAARQIRGMITGG